MQTAKKQIKYLVEHRSEFNSRRYQFFSYAADVGYVRPTTVNEVLPTVLAKDTFEGYSFCIPQNPDKVLTANFGKTYMQLPPVTQRKTHAKMIKI